MHNNIVTLYTDQRRWWCRDLIKTMSHLVVKHEQLTTYYHDINEQIGLDRDTFSWMHSVVTDV